MVKKRFLPLFWKFLIAVVSIVAVFGSINFLFLNFTFNDLFEKEINRHGYTIAKSIAEQSVDGILYDDLANLNKLVTDKIRIDSEIAYILILDENNNVLAHSFNDLPPVSLVNLSNNSKVEIYQRIVDRNNLDASIRDVTVPILQGNLGHVRIGIYEESFLNSISKINYFFLTLLLLFLVIGITGAFFFSYIITYPIKKIYKIAENINLTDIQKLSVNSADEDFLNVLIKIKNLIKYTDEIDILSDKFEEMLERLKNAYHELQDAQFSLIQSEKMASLGTLSAGLAHEINNPIAGLKNCLRRIKEDPNNEEQRVKYLELMNDAVLKIENVVGGLLNFTRKQEMKMEQVYFPDIIENVLLLSSFQLEKSRISLVKKYSDNLPFCTGSSNHLEQLVLNLLLNSIDSINEKMQNNLKYVGEIDFVLSFSHKEVIFEIRDNGIGIKQENLQSIFDPFFTDKKIRQGTGLGLSVCYNIVQQHNGTITAVKNKLDGMTFRISIPIKRNELE